jgi:hypothetical protein
VAALPRVLRAAYRQLEIIVLELLAGMLRAVQSVRGGQLVRGGQSLRGGRSLRGLRPRLHWVSAVGVVLAVAIALTAVLLPRSAARPSSQRPSTGTAPSLVAEPTLTPSDVIGAEAFAGAARRAPATAPLRRLPQVDLNGLTIAGIPPAALAAYVTAARTTGRTDAGCHLRWWLLAGIGLVESGHARSGGSATAAWNGIARPPIYGPRLDGTHGFAAIHDTDRGLLDRDRKWDRAVGPMQFLPSTWHTWGGTDRHGRMRDPQDIRAAATATAAYLCAGGANLAQLQGMATAVYGYNHSFDYVRLVLSVAARYAGLTPDALGVNRLPHDKPAAKKHPKGGATAGSSPAPAPSATAAGASPSASPSSSGSPAATPSPSSSGASLPPLPTPSSITHLH